MYCIWEFVSDRIGMICCLFFSLKMGLIHVHVLGSCLKGVAVLDINLCAFPNVFVTAFDSYIDRI